MKILIVTDAWHPQVNGVVRTLERLQVEATRQGANIEFLTPDRYATAPLPFYPEIRMALASPPAIGAAIKASNPDIVHISTEGPLGWLARHWAIENKRPFTTCYHTRYPQYISARIPIPEAFTYCVLRHFHNASSVTMVATPSLQQELAAQGFTRMRIWSRGVDSDLFRPRPEASIDLPKPIHLCVARIAVEKNLEAFLSLDLPGSKVIVGDGPDRPLLQSRYPDAHFLGARFGEDLATLYSAADVFVFPSKTETFGLVMLEALASGVPVAAFPVSGLIQELAQHGCAATHNDLGLAAREALALLPAKCRDFALSFTHTRSTRQFLDNVASVIDQPLTLAA